MTLDCRTTPPPPPPPPQKKKTKNEPIYSPLLFCFFFLKGYGTPLPLGCLQLGLTPVQTGGKHRTTRTRSRSIQTTALNGWRFLCPAPLLRSSFILCGLRARPRSSPQSPHQMPLLCNLLVSGCPARPCAPQPLRPLMAATNSNRGWVST